MIAYCWAYKLPNVKNRCKWHISSVGAFVCMRVSMLCNHTYPHTCNRLLLLLDNRKFIKAVVAANSITTTPTTIILPLSKSSRLLQ